MPNLKDALRARGLLTRIALPSVVDALLTALQPGVPVGSGADVRGTASLGLAATPLGFLSLDLKPPGPAMPFHLVADDAAGTFRLWLTLSDAAPAKKLFGFATGLTGTVLAPATVAIGDGHEWLEASGGEVVLTGVAVAILVEGMAGAEATMRLVPTDGQPGGLVTLGLDPPAVLLGSSGFGLELPDGVTIDESATEVAPGQTVIAGHVRQIDADIPSWRGLVARRARFFVPRGVPLLGGHAVDAYVEVGSAPGQGINVALATRWEPQDGGTGMDVLIECREPGALGLQDFVPTLVEAAMTLPLEESAPQVSGQALSVLAGKPVVARLRFARSTAKPTTRMTLGVESQGPNGVLTVRAPDGGVPARAVISAGALATALVADKQPPGADVTGVGLHALLVVALGLSSFLKDQGRLTLNGVELASEGHGVPVGGAVKLTLDYSVDVIVKPISVGALSVSMRDEQPMRVRNRNVGLTYDTATPGLDRFRLDFSRSDMEIEDPGAWIVDSPASLFDILGTRSGRGSMWLEVDLRFKLNLGPVKVSGATIRATRADDGTFSADLRGLDASIDVPGVVRGGGRFQPVQGGGFAAELDVDVVPLNLSAGALVDYRPEGDSFRLFLRLGIELPGPIPIANTGLGMFGVAGSFGVNARPALPPPGHPDPIGFQLEWDSANLNAWTFSRGDLTIGAELVIGTVPDLGFSFSTKGGLFLTIPDLAIRGALWGKVLSPRLRVTDRPRGPDVGLSFRGVVVVDPREGVTIGLKGELHVPVLIDAVVPLGARFGSSAAGGDPTEWFIHLGSDGYVNPYRTDGRALGPMRATVLPDLMPTSADAYLMQLGHGIDKWPRGQPGAISIADGFVVAFGFGFEYTLGVEGLVWAEVHASLDVLLATRPLTLAGFGTVGGSLNLGPFSIGVDADLRFLVAENADPYIHARLCGRIDLFFTDIEGCVEISIHNPPKREVPPPDVHPLDDVQNGQPVGDLAFLIDDGYRRLAPLSRTAAGAATVWPDTLLHIAFARSPVLAPGYAGGQFSGIDTYPSGLAAQPVGSDMLRYDWSLTKLALVDVTDDPDGPGTPVVGPLSAAWQVGKDGDIGVRPQAGDLVLLTYQGDLWINRLADAGTSLPGDPLGEAGRLCEDEPGPESGWVVGWGATGSGGLLHLPPDPIVTDPRGSRFSATLRLAWSRHPDEPLGVRTAAKVPAPYTYRTPSFTVADPPLELERAFDGILELGGIAGPIGQMAANTALLLPSEPLEDPRLWLVFEQLEDREGITLGVNDDRGDTWKSTEEPLRDGRLALRFAPTVPGPVRSISIFWRLGTCLGLLGLGGLTDAALRATDARRTARAAAAAVQLAAAATQPQPPGTTTGAGARCVLAPGRLYRLDVGLAWSGRLYEQQEDGSTTEVASALDQDEYRPAGGDARTGRSYFFRTAPKPAGGGLGLTWGDYGFLALIHRSQARFEPEMLARHLAGYSPEQSEAFRFCDDPLQAHFRVAHAATLAQAYGYDLRLGLRRVDAPGEDGEEKPLVASWLALALPELLGLADRRRTKIAIGARCAMPRPGATLQALTPLALHSWYEVFVLAKATGRGQADGRLPGTTFRTSRWRTPAEMLDALGFRTAPGAAAGDVEIREQVALNPATADGADATFELAMSALGLDGWPPAGPPRASLLWVPGAPEQWRLAGVLVESPEPIDRPGRCEIQRLHAPGVAATFDLRRSDRNRSRVLFLTSAPFAPAGSPATVVLEQLDRATGTVLSGALAVPSAPAFAAEP
jgi:hypothetical protein